MTWSLNNPRHRRALLALAALVLTLAWPPPLEAAPKSEPWPRWTAHDPASPVVVDHGAWAGLLARRLSLGTDGISRFDYAAVGPVGRARLAAYIASLEAVPVSRLSRPQQLAYWINLYNAATVRVVLDHIPVASIRDIDLSPGLFGFGLRGGPWGGKLLGVEGVSLSLDDIEHRILRPIWRDPRIHYAVNCAALGCPNLALVPYQAGKINDQLDAAARAYVNHPRAAQLTPRGLRVSRIYDWYKADFGGTDENVIAHLKSHAGADLAAALKGVSKIAAYDYDWRLNGTSEPGDGDGH